MREGLNKPSSASRLPIPVLIADKNSSVVDFLATVLRNSIPGIALSLCYSHSYAMHSLTVARYQVVVCGVQFAEAQSYLLLRQHRAFQSFVPFIVIAQGQEWELVKTVLQQQGVEDIIVWPLHKGQPEDSVREAMSLYQMRATIAHRRQTLNTLRSCESFPAHEKVPVDNMCAQQLLPKQTLRVLQRTIQRMETNLKHLTEMVHDAERQARARALEHLNLLGREQG
jgi:PleD family two-component response regulator